MTLKEALLKPNKTPLPSVKLQVIENQGARVIKGGSTMTTYRVTDGKESALLRIFFVEKVTLFVGVWYIVKALPSTKGFEGVYTSLLNSEKGIRCESSAVFHILTQPIKMTQPAQAQAEIPQVQVFPAPPYTADQLENYCLRRYFNTREKAMTKTSSGITPEQAHEVGLEMMSRIPQYFFGEKQLP